MMDWLTTLASCASTNDEALARLGATGHGDAITASVQTAGRGRSGKRWQSPPGVLAVSYRLDFPGPAVPPLLGPAAAVAVVRALHEVGVAAPLRCKWPNDVLCHERKLAGILCEGRDGRAVVGIGCNLDPDWQAAGLDPAHLDATGLRAVSCAELGYVPERAALLTALRAQLLVVSEDLGAGDHAGVVAEFAALDALRDRRCRASLPDGRELVGHGAGIGRGGRLLLRDSAGTLHSVESATIALEEPGASGRTAAAP